MKRKITFVLSTLCVVGALAQLRPVKVDFDKADRGASEVHETGYEVWGITNCSDTTKVINGITFTLANNEEESGGAGLKSHWYKAGIQAPYYARLVSDGVIVNGGDVDGGVIDLTITGLEPGQHSLLTYHNQFDSPDDKTFGEICISVNDEEVVRNLPMTQRVLNNYDAATAYITFEAQKDVPVKVTFRPNYDTDLKNSLNIVINGFVLDMPDPKKQANRPFPADRDFHMDADNKQCELKWTGADHAVMHQLYFGTDSTEVDQATPLSNCYKGKFSETTFSASDLTTIKFYYWRVDEIDAHGTVTKGDIWQFSPRHIAFPGAEGYGRFSRGGRGGRVVYVTTLDDYDPTSETASERTPIPGSLRYVVTEEKGPRTIVFAVSGLITLKTRLTLSSSFVTIAGQTSPNKGICIKSAPFGFSGVSDGIMRFMRIRLGAGKTYDGTGLNGAEHCIFDHNSVGWTIDEAFSSRSGKNFTLQRTMLTEALNMADHQNYPEGTRHGYAASIGGDIGSFHHNLLAHCEGRNWSLAGGLDADGNFSGRLDIFNNVVYNWGKRTTDGGSHEVNFVNNYYKPGAATNQFYALNLQHDDFPGTQRYYCNGNLVEGKFEDLSNPQNGCRDGSWPNGNKKYDPFVAQSFFESYATVHTAKDAYKHVLSDVGCTMPVFDNQDVRVVNETLTGTYTYVGSKSGDKGLPDSQQDVGGWENYPVETVNLDEFDTDRDGLPNWWESMFGTNLHSTPGDFSDSNADDDKDGYTNLEEYLNYMATPHTEIKVDETIEIDLAPYTRGFEKSPVYTVAQVSNLTATIQNARLKVTPVKGFGGIQYLDVLVKDADGAAMTRSFAIKVGDKSTATGIHAPSEAQNAISVYPNPTVDYLYVSAQAIGEESGLIEVFTAYGKQLLTEVIQTSAHEACRVDVTSLPAGVYLLRVRIGEKSSITKFIKKQE